MGGGPLPPNMQTAPDDPAYRQKWENKLWKFMEDRGTPIVRVPMLGKKPVNLYILYHNTINNGGYEIICKNRMWKAMAWNIELPETCTNAGYSLRTNYEKLLLPFERVDHRGLSDAPNEVIANDLRKAYPNTGKNKVHTLPKSNIKVAPPPMSAMISSIAPPSAVAHGNHGSSANGQRFHPYTRPDSVNNMPHMSQEQHLAQQQYRRLVANARQSSRGAYASGGFKGMPQSDLANRTVDYRKENPADKQFDPAARSRRIFLALTSASDAEVEWGVDALLDLSMHPQFQVKTSAHVIDVLLTIMHKSALKWDYLGRQTCAYHQIAKPRVPIPELIEESLPVAAEEEPAESGGKSVRKSKAEIRRQTELAAIAQQEKEDEDARQKKELATLREPFERHELFNEWDHLDVTRTATAEEIECEKRHRLILNILFNVSFQPENASTMANHSALVIFLNHLLETRHSGLYMSVLDTLSNLARATVLNPGKNTAIVRHAIANLSSRVSDIVLASLDVLVRLAQLEENEPVLRNAEDLILEAVFPHLTSDDPEVQLSAVDVVFNLSYFSKNLVKHARPILAQMMRLVHFTDDDNRPDLNVQRKAALTLSNLAMRVGCREYFVPYSGHLLDAAFLGNECVTDVLQDIVVTLDIDS